MPPAGIPGAVAPAAWPPRRPVPERGRDVGRSPVDVAAQDVDQDGGWSPCSTQDRWLDGAGDAMGSALVWELRRRVTHRRPRPSRGHARRRCRPSPDRRCSGSRRLGRSRHGHPNPPPAAFNGIESRNVTLRSVGEYAWRLRFPRQHRRVVRSRRRSSLVRVVEAGVRAILALRSATRSRRGRR